ncbi:hypothetical protein RE6C_01412 [Rhodopirellula europaea 6C]|uniref:Uncharacterized protein n=1 Tax=Rhodopirellula europaea 6C TaxID=1263867 RepID=M2B810_9BACT|nr:hypothetical protein RE6C_01412 [Rhodopirellula europaea 6C]
MHHSFRAFEKQTAAANRTMDEVTAFRFQLSAFSLNDDAVFAVLSPFSHESNIAR